MIGRSGVLKKGFADKPYRKLRVIGREEIEEAAAVMKKYKAGKAILEQRIIDNEKWFRMKNDLVKRSGGEETSRSAWLLNSIMNKHADAMDNYPEPRVLPREMGDEPDAAMLSGILPVMLDVNDYEQVYSDVWWYKLKQGTGVTGVFWNPRKENGLGDAEIRKIDLLNLFWEPGVADIQESGNLFHAALWDTDTLKETYPDETRELTGANTGELALYAHDESRDTSEKSLVTDWYYRKRGVLHMCKYTQGIVLYATENDPALKDTGIYKHGMYPFVFDPLFPIENSPAGYGMIDLMRGPQETIDRLDALLLNNTAFNAAPRYFISDQAGVNEKEFADMNKAFIHVTGQINPAHIQPVGGKELSAGAYTMRQYKIDELKETSGNRDVNTGGAQSGVTAASAIAAMQEAGSKLSRDMIRASYRAFEKICRLLLEIVREFYTMPRSFRIIGESGAQEYVRYQNTRIADTATETGFGLDDWARRPIFDIKIVTHKANPYSRVSQNELAKELYQLGMFNPQMAEQALMVIEMMDFEGKDKVRTKIAENARMARQMQAMQEKMGQMAQLIDLQNGTNVTEQFGGGQAEAQPMPNARPVQTRSGEKEEPGIVKRARERAAELTAPQ